MIGKLTKGSSHGGALKYDLEKEGAELLETNCASNDWREIAAEMDVVAASNTKSTKTCLHLSMSAPDGENLSDKQWVDSAHIAIKDIGLEGNQYVITRHNDSGHSHIHITINRINDEGKSWNDSKDYQRVHEAMRSVEVKMGLERIEYHQITKDGRFKQVQSDLNDSVKDARGRGLDGLKSEMKSRGYTIIENKSKATGRIAGISIQSDQDQKTWKSSELLKGGYKNIEQQLNNIPQLTNDHSSSSDSRGSLIANGLAKGIKSMPKVPGLNIPKLPMVGGGLVRKLIETSMKSAEQHVKKASKEIER